jgi:IS30 family transposase
MDFVEGLPKSKGNDVIMVVVERFNKYAHFMSLNHPYSAPIVAKIFMDNVYKLHDLLTSIVSDKDTMFFSKFWKEMFSIQGVNLLYLSVYCPQTDGQTEIVNKYVENYLRCMTGDNPNQWARWLLLAKWWYNMNFHSSTKLTPYEVLYNFSPPIHVPYFPKDSTVELINDLLTKREEIIKQIKCNLRTTQHRITQIANNKRSFFIGDYVHLKLQHYKQQLVVRRASQKLSAKFFDLYLVIDMVDKVAYKLELPPSSAIHHVFHVS